MLYAEQILLNRIHGDLGKGGLNSARARGDKTFAKFVEENPKLAKKIKRHVLAEYKKNKLPCT